MNNSNHILRAVTVIIFILMGVYFFSDSKNLPPMKDNMRYGFGAAFFVWGIFRGVQLFLKIKNKDK